MGDDGGFGGGRARRRRLRLGDSVVPPAAGPEPTEEPETRAGAPDGPASAWDLLRHQAVESHHAGGHDTLEGGRDLRRCGVDDSHLRFKPVPAPTPSGVPSAAETTAAVPLTGNNVLPGAGVPTVSPSPRSAEETCATSAARRAVLRCILRRRQVVPVVGRSGRRDGGDRLRPGRSGSGRPGPRRGRAPGRPARRRPGSSRPARAARPGAGRPGRRRWPRRRRRRRRGRGGQRAEP